MTTLGAQQLLSRYRSPDFRSRFVELYSLRVLWDSCLKQTRYAPPTTVDAAIVLSPLGHAILERALGSAHGEIPQSMLKLALFLLFGHDELLIDVEHSDANALRKALSHDVCSSRVRYPWVFGRCLYDRFCDMYSERPDALSPEDTARFLHGTPQGVFQVAHSLVGPLGVLRSSANRDLSPLRNPLLWHCPEPSCRKPHPVVLTDDCVPLSKARSLVLRETRESHSGPRSEWDRFFHEVSSPASYYDDYHPGGLPWLLGNSLVDSDMRTLTAMLLAHASEVIRSRLPDTSRIRRVFRQPPEGTVANLSIPECLQVILLATDEAVAESIECLIDDGAIRIPPTEVRVPVFRLADSWHSSQWQCSQFGVRVVPSRGDVGPIRLATLVKRVFSDPQGTQQMEWILRHVEGRTTQERLDHLLFQSDPREFVRQFFFSTQERLTSALRLLRYGRVQLPSSTQEEDWLVNRILWKLGFNIGLYPPLQGQFWNRLDDFFEVVRTEHVYNEQERERVRGVGVNFFVSLEEVLDSSLSFAAWALLSDHYGHTRFRYNPEEARRLMASSLNESEGDSATSGDHALRYDSEGTNTLFPLVHGFGRLATLLSRFTADDRQRLTRPRDDCPGYDGQSTVQLFPFHHRLLLVDLPEEDQRQLLERLRYVTARLAACDVCGTRNRVQHSRRPEQFPTATELDHCLREVSAVVDEMEQWGLCPLVRYFAGSSTDSFGRATVRLRDYKGRELALHKPSPYSRAIPVRASDPVIVIPSMHVGDSSEPIQFSYEELSEYALAWRDYPRLKSLYEIGAEGTPEADCPDHGQEANAGDARP